MDGSNNGQQPISLQDVYLIVGEREVLRILLQKRVEEQARQIAELQAEVERLRGEREDRVPVFPSELRAGVKS